MREVGGKGHLAVIDRQLDGRPVGEEEEGVGEATDADLRRAADDDRVELAWRAVLIGLEDLDDGAQGRLGRLVVVPVDVPVRGLDAERSRPVASINLRICLAWLRRASSATRRSRALILNDSGIT